MAIVKPFSAIRPTVESAARVASVPYDVINREEAREMASGNEETFLRVIRSDLDLDDSVSPYDDKVYQTAVDNLNKLIDKGSLVKEDQAIYYAYSISVGDHEQIGVIGLSSVDDYENGIVKVHEKTRPEKLEDRTRHMLELKAHTGPVLLTFKDSKEVAEVVANASEGSPLFTFVADDQVRHTVWKIEETNKLEEAFKKVDATYIADGHHRAESSKLCRERLKAENSSHNGSEDYNYFLTVLFPESELRILAYNRAVKQFPEGLDSASALNQILEVMEVVNEGIDTPESKGLFSIYIDGKWLCLKFKEAAPNDPVLGLDASVLQDRIFQPIFDIDDPRTNPNIDFVGGIRGTGELERLVDSGKAVAAFSLFPVTVEELISVADSGKTMPPKSTWFEPKLRSGIAINKF